MRLLLLSELVEAAGRLRPDDPLAALLAAFDRGLALLEAEGAGGGGGRVEAEPERIRRCARFDVQRQRTLVLSERQERLEREVGELAAESLALHERLWDGHERASRMKVELGRRRAATARPEAPLTIGGSGRRRAGRADRLLAGLSLVAVELPLGPAAAERALAAVERLGWRDDRFDDALASVLAAGLAALELDQPAADPASGAEPLSGGETAAEALAYRVFELSESIRILEIRANAFRIDNQGMRRRLEQLERELGELEGEVTALRQRPDGAASNGLRRRFLDGRWWRIRVDDG